MTTSGFVSRAGEKLAFALDHFGIDPAGAICADLGCHVGGFTDCLLQRGAARVYAVDTGHHILHWRLRNDPRVVVMERTNALHARLPELVDLVTVDVAWTPQRRVLPHAVELLRPGGVVISLIKPQYEAQERERVRGVVRDERVAEVVERVLRELVEVGLDPVQVVESPLLGGKGRNREFLLLCQGREGCRAPRCAGKERPVSE